ncbi:hypothetical protein [Actinoplanes sp. TFC3]|uniref:hypothetical protein n=1 Tax=Actinoplanes sp. TFC3 TaxID=1710355 RepID=UPI00082E01C9|nr:hypothetical protein [Actinoplanes sp. TFC3]
MAEPSGNDTRVEVRVRLADLDAVRWPQRPLVGDGADTTPVAVPLPHLAWTRTATVPVPVGTGVADRVAVVLRLRKLYEYAVLPAILVLLVLAAAMLVLSWPGTVPNGRFLGGVLGIAAFTLILLGFGLQVLAVAARAPRVAGGELLLARAHADVAREAIALNPSGLVRIHQK